MGAFRQKWLTSPLTAIKGAPDNENYFISHPAVALMV